MSFLEKLPYPILALIATIFTWSITALGACVVFFFKNIKKNVMDAMLGFAAGVMIAASFFSLISPAIEMSTNLKLIPWLVCFIGVMLGGILLFLGDKFYDFFTKKIKKKNTEANLKRVWLLVISITLHNIPEGLAIGVAFGSLAYHIDGATLASAFTLALGIGIQNFPEGSAVSLPLLREGFSRKKAFGRCRLIISATSKNNVPRTSSKPFL